MTPSLWAEMPQQRFRQALHVRVEFPEERETLLGDAHLDDASILTAAGARDETPIGEAVDEPCHVGISLNHALCDVAAG